MKKVLMPLALAAALSSILLIPATAQSEESNDTSAQILAEGAAAPPFALTASDGTSHSLEAAKGKKNVVLVFFRGTW